MSDNKLRAEQRAREVLQRLSGLSDSLTSTDNADTSVRIAEKLQQIEQLFLLHGGQRSGPHANQVLFEWGHLQVLEPIGEGSFGEVFRAYDRALDREVALKLLKTDHERPFQSQLFLHEGRQLAMVRHRNVLAVHGAAVHDGRPGLWSDLIDGKTAQDDQNCETLLPLEAKLEFIESIALALQAVHAAGLVHGDIKPGNVMRDAAGEWILMDFGASLDHGSTDQMPPIASGTPLYMAPEVVLGASPDRNADVYSLGAMFYRVLIGSPPFEVNQWSDLLTCHEREQQVPRALIDNDRQGRVGKLIDWMLSIDPDQRPDPKQILAEIQAIRQVPHRRFRRLALSSIVVVLIAGLIASSVGFFRAENALQLAQLEQTNTAAVNRFLQRILVSPSQTGRVRDLSVEDMLREAASDTQNELAGQPQAQVSVRRMLAESFNVLDRQDLALEQIQLARELIAEHGLVMHEVSRRLDDQEIRAVLGQGRHEDSLALAENFIRNNLAELGDHHSRIRFARIHKVSNLIGLSRFEEALAIMETHFEAIPPPDPEQQNLGFGVLVSWTSVYRGLGRFQEALSAAQNTVEWLAHYPSVNLFNEISALNALATALSDVNQQGRAIEVYDEMLPLIERVYGRNSMQYIASWINLASIHRETGNLLVAQDTLEHAIELMRRYPEAAGVDAELVVEMNLANLVNANGDAERAEAMMRSVWPKMIDHRGASHSMTLTLEYNLAELLSQQGRFDAARALAERTLASKREALGDAHTLTLISMDNLAVALSGLGRGSEALELHDQALAVLADQLGTEHPYALMIERHRMATLQSFAPDRIEANAIEALIERHEQALGTEHFDTEKARLLLASD